MRFLTCSIFNLYSAEDANDKASSYYSQGLTLIRTEIVNNHTGNYEILGTLDTNFIENEEFDWKDI